jgi:hypothetical protein
MKGFLTFLACMGLALGSFAFARYHYVEVHTFTASNPFKTSQKAQMTDPFINQSLFGDWVKDEWVFAIAIPAVLIVSGLVLSSRK